MKDLLKLAALILIIAFFALACASSQKQSDFELDVDDDEIGQADVERVKRRLARRIVVHEIAFAPERRRVVLSYCRLVFDDRYSFGHTGS